jgi:hypothetical protein
MVCISTFSQYKFHCLSDLLCTFVLLQILSQAHIENMRIVFIPNMLLKNWSVYQLANPTQKNMYLSKKRTFVYIICNKFNLSRENLENIKIQYC